MKCNLCPNFCDVDRDETIGKCRSGSYMRICRIAPHYYEEPIISGDKGSGTIFFSGCSLDCLFCQNHEISKKSVGKVFSPEDLADAMKKMESSGVHNINLVTPTHFSHRIIEALKIYRPNIPIVYNTSGYERPEIIQALLPYVDIFLTDVKYAHNELAAKYSGVDNYVDYCLPSTDVMVDNKPIIIRDGLMMQGVIVRHLVLPTELNNTFDVIDLFADRWKDRAYFSLMGQFFPTYHSPISRTLKPVEYKLCCNRIMERGIDNCFVQELSSASESYVPDFDLK